MIKDMNQPNHYAKNSVLIMPIDLIRDLRGNASNALKYLIRCKDKNSELEDIKKAIDYLTDIVNAQYDSCTIFTPRHHINEIKFQMALIYYTFSNKYINCFFTREKDSKPSFSYSKLSAQKTIDMLKTDYGIEN